MKRPRIDPLFGAVLIFAVAQVLTLYIAFREKDFVEANQITSPQASAGLPIAYFLGVAALMGLVLFLIPISRLRIVLKIMFTFLFGWGAFVALALCLPVIIAAVVSAAAGLLWLFRPRVWLHNALMVLALVSAAAVFGFVLSPWATMLSMLVLSVYDVLAVRFGYMMWMAKRLSESESLPVFLIPRRISTWNLNLRGTGFSKLFEDAAEREFSILGGGDIGFPLLLVVSVFFAHGFTGSLIVSGFSLLGLISAYLIQLFFLKGRPMPALPPISVLSLIGFVIVSHG